MKLLISTWTHHLNHLLYSYIYFCEREKIKINIVFSANVAHNGALLIIENKSLFFDYSDDPKFIENSCKFDYYFKRSLRQSDHKGNIFPLNFNVPLSYKAPLLLHNLNKGILFNKFNKIEVVRALDIFGYLNSSHKVIDVRRYPKRQNDSGGRILFHTRLWNPDNHPDPLEKERRRLQNDFRINCCRIVKKQFKNSSVGLSGDNFSKKVAPDLILPIRESKKRNYLKTLSQYDIGIADDGLKDSPGWKIGEYLFYGKAVISTPLNIVVDDFNVSKNYSVLSSRQAYDEVPDKIIDLLQNKRYLEMGTENKLWSDYYIHPKNYVKRILSLI